jgi:DNA-binding GntR family transcriptional regulator
MNEGVSMGDRSAAPQTGALWVEPLHERVTGRLRDMVVDGRLKPGAPISEKALCDEFGISRTPLREALKVLASEGLIELLPRRGAVVTPIVTERLREMFAIVRLLEDYSIKLVCEHASDEHIAELEAIHTRLVRGHGKLSNSAYVELNEQFHRALVEASGNQSLVDVHAPIATHLHRARTFAMQAQDVSRNLVAGHERIMKAVRKRDAAAAIRAMEARWAIAEQVLEKLAEPAPAATRAPKDSRPRSIK